LVFYLTLYYGVRKHNIKKKIDQDIFGYTWTGTFWYFWY